MVKLVCGIMTWRLPVYKCNIIYTIINSSLDKQLIEENEISFTA